MLHKLTIKNVALIENAQIQFNEGLNVLSGETGAGKSVILDSVNFVLGAKADKSMIRYGEDECMVKAEFIVEETAQAVQLLQEMDIDSNGEIIISRKFSQNGKNSIKINGSTVTASMLRKITDSLVDVHGQSEHFFLLKESNQLKTLDNVIGDALNQDKQNLHFLLTENKKIDEQIALLGGNESERERRLDIIKFQIDEIINVNLQENEEEELISKRNKMNNLEKIISSLQETIGILSGEVGVLDGLRMAIRTLAHISKLDDGYQELFDKLDGLYADTLDVNDSLSAMGNELYFDENEAEYIENRLDAIRSLKRKYGVDKQQIDAYLQNLQKEYDLLIDAEEQYNRLSKKKQENLDKIYCICLNITKLRKKEGKDFCQRVVEELKTLNIPHAKFDIEFNEYTKEDVLKATANGLDTICFTFSANAGEPVKPLGKIISGGEMSRFMLAIKTQLSSINEISTYIFDEIDAGISGQTAKVVGEKLGKIAKNIQIIAVSHLAQIAVMSDSQYLIEKVENSGKTFTNVNLLDEKAKIKEIVRMLGGSAKDDFAFKHAEELLKQAKDYKNSLN